MTAKEIAADMMQWNKGAAFITPEKLRNYLGCGREYVRGLLDGVEFIRKGSTKGKFYHVLAVAERISEYRRIS